MLPNLILHSMKHYFFKQTITFVQFNTHTNSPFCSVCLRKEKFEIAIHDFRNVSFELISVHFVK